MSHRSVSAMHRFCVIAITVFLLTACANQVTPAPLALDGAVTQTAPAAQASQPRPATATSTPEPTPTSTPTTEPTSTLTPTSTPTAEVTPGAVVRGDQNINLRKGPGSDYDGLGPIAPGATMEVVATAEMNGQTWYRVKLADGRLGWVREDLVEANEKVGAVPKASGVPPTPTLQPRPTATPRLVATEQPRVEVDFDNPKIRMFYLNNRTGDKEMLPLGVLNVKDYPHVSVVSQESVDYSLVQQLLSGIVVAKPHVDGRFLVIPFAIETGGGIVHLNVHLYGGRFGLTPVRPNLGAAGYFAGMGSYGTSRAIEYDDFVREAKVGLQYVLEYYGGSPDAMGAFIDAKLKQYSGNKDVADRLGVNRDNMGETLRVLNGLRSGDISSGEFSVYPAGATLLVPQS